MRITAWALGFAAWVVDARWQIFAEFILNFFVGVGLVLWWIFMVNEFFGLFFSLCFVVVLVLFWLVLFLFAFILS